MSLIPDISVLNEHVDNRSWLPMEEAAHKLKSPAAYIGASRVQYSCFMIMKLFRMDDYQGMLDYYPLVIESAIELRVQLRYYIAECKSKSNDKFDSFN